MDMVAYCIVDGKDKTQVVLRENTMEVLLSELRKHSVTPGVMHGAGRWWKEVACTYPGFKAGKKNYEVYIIDSEGRVQPPPSRISAPLFRKVG